MRLISRRTTLLAGACTLAMPMSWADPLAPYPSRPIQLIHGFGAGGNADVVSRLIAQRLQTELKQSVIVEIKSGSGGSIASGTVAKATPDGYTLVMLTGAHTVSAALRKNLPYDAVKDFSFISTVSSFPFVIAVSADHPATTLPQLLEMAKQRQISFTSVGIGSTQHMVGELLNAAANIQMLHIPYRGGGAPITAVISKEVDVLADTLTVALPHIQSGRLRALAVTSAQPWPTLPDVPAVAATLQDFEVRSWLGLAAPAGIPAPIGVRLNAEVHKALQNPEVQRSLSDLGSVASPSTSEAMHDMVQAEISRWQSVIVRRGIQLS